MSETDLPNPENLPQKKEEALEPEIIQLKPFDAGPIRKTVIFTSGTELNVSKAALEEVRKFKDKVRQEIHTKEIKELKAKAKWASFYKVICLILIGIIFGTVVVIWFLTKMSQTH